MTIPEDTKSPMTTLTPDDIAEMRRVDNSANPMVLPVGKVTAAWTGHLLEKDDGKWADWSYNMGLELSMVQLWEYVFNPPATPHQTYEPRAYRALEGNNRLACSFIKRAISAAEQKLCAEEWNPVRLWEHLKGRHGGAVPVQQVRLLQEALTMKCSPTESLTKTADSICEKIERAFQAGEVTKELLQSIAILSSLSDKAYAHIRSIISRDLTTAGDVEKYGPTEIRRFLEGEQTLIDADKSTPAPTDHTPTAFTARTSKYDRLICTACRAKGRTSFTGHTKPWCILEGGGMSGKTVEESKQARLAYYDAQRKEKDAKKKTSRITITPNGGSAFTVEGDSEAIAAYIAAQGEKSTSSTKAEFAGIASDSIPGYIEDIEAMEFEALVAVEEECGYIKLAQDTYENELYLSNSSNIPLDILPFYLDSGATVHISPDRSDFLDLTPIPDRQIRGVGGSDIAATGIGSIRLNVRDGTHIVIDNALYVPKSTVRLLSVSKLAKSSGIYTTFNDNGAMLIKKDSNTIIATGSLIPKKDLYALNLHHDHAYAIYASPSIITWHNRLGHANYQAILQMARAGMIDGMPKTFSEKPPVCDECILGKQARTPVPKKREEGRGHKATRRLEKIWVDLTGQAAMPSRTGNHYIMNVVDDYSNKPWSIPLKTKADAFGELQAWILARENETGEAVWILRTGHDGELNGESHKIWYKSKGIVLETGAPYTSAHMGRVERMHRTLMGKARSMRIAAKCPPYLWDEFYLTAAYLHGKTKTSIDNNSTPDELWYGKRPDYSYLREIGCRVFVLVLNKHNPKIYERSIECVLIGYDINSKAYRCYERSTRKVYSSYHVKFIESHQTMTSLPAQETEELSEHPSIDVIMKESHPYPTAQSFDEEEPIKIPGVKNLVQVSDHGAEQIMPVDAPVLIPEPIAPRRSSRTSIPTQKAALDNQTETRTEKAVRESRESAERVREARTVRRQALNELVQAIPEVAGDDNVGVEELDRVITTLSAIDESDPGDDPDTPRSLEEAQNSVDWQLWKASYQDEIDSLKEMGVWELVPRENVPADQKIFKGRPVFTIKRDEHGKITRLKTRHVLQGYTMVQGRDYDKTTSPTARAESWRILLHLAATMGWDATQVDVKTAFLNGVLPEEERIYMQQPRCFEEEGKETWVCRLRRPIYGMKQAGRIWNKTLDDVMKDLGFLRLKCEACLYYRKTDRGIVITGVHVDDFLSIASTKEANDQFKEQLKARWVISDLGTPRHIIGMAVEWDRAHKQVFLSQTTLIDRLTSQYGQQDASPLSVPMEPGLKLRRVDKTRLTTEEREKIARIPYRNLVGGLLWLAISTRPDIQYAVQQLSQFLDCYTSTHWHAAIRVLRYLKGTRSLRLRLGGDTPINLVGFTDSDWANCLDTRRSVGGYAWSLGSGLISWCTRKQRTVAASSCEAEYMAAFEAAQEGIWLRMVMSALGHGNNKATTILCDNNSAINLSEDPLLHSRVKHVDIKYHFLRERVASNEILLRYINTKDNVADIFTKALPSPQFGRLRSILGLQDPTRGGAHLR